MVERVEGSRVEDEGGRGEISSKGRWRNGKRLLSSFGMVDLCGDEMKIAHQPNFYGARTECTNPIRASQTNT